MPKTRLIHPWTKEPCHHCGNEYQVTRADPVTVPENKELLCCCCDSYKTGYEEGLQHGKPKRPKGPSMLKVQLIAAVGRFMDDDKRRVDYEPGEARRSVEEDRRRAKRLVLSLLNKLSAAKIDKLVRTSRENPFNNRY